MKELGIEPILLLAQIINFGIIAFVLNKFLFKPILKMLSKRQDEIEEGLALTEKMKEEEDKVQQKREKLLDVARKDSQSILEEAKKQAKKMEKDILADAHKQASEVLEKAQAQAEQTRKDALKDMRSEAVEIALEMVKRVLPGTVSTADHRKLFSKQLDELEKVKAKVN